MGVYLMKRSDGSLDPRWHGQWTVDGKRKHASLNLWRGTPPGPGEKEGDAAFERSRSKALETLKTVSEEEKSKAEERNAQIAGSYANVSNDTRNVIDNRKLNFHQDIDVRGMRGDEAVNAITYFIDDAILVGMSRVRILHGTGTGILRQLIRQYLSTIPNVKSYRDEHVQFGGAGITVVDLD